MVDMRRLPKVGSFEYCSAASFRSTGVQSNWWSTCAQKEAADRAFGVRADGQTSSRSTRDRIRRLIKRPTRSDSLSSSNAKPDKHPS